MPGHNHSNGLKGTDAEHQFLQLSEVDASEIVDRIRETRVGEMGRAYLLRLDILAQGLGQRWEAKRDLVFDHLKTNFERKFQEPNWCVRLNDDAFLAVISTFGERMGALSAADLWYTVGQFFVGDVSNNKPPLYEAIAQGVDLLRLVPIDLDMYFDRDGANPRPGPSVTTRTAEVDLPAMRDKTEGFRSAVGVRTGGTFLTIGPRRMYVETALEPVFELGNLALIGHRFRAAITDLARNVLLDTKAAARLDWGEREQIDLAAIEQGIKRMRELSHEQRKIVMIVPAAFSTFANVRTRGRILAALSSANQEWGLKIIFEVGHLVGVPTGRLTEIVGMLRPYCVAVIGHSAADARSLRALKGSRLAGAVVEYDGHSRDEPALEAYLHSLSSVARQSTRACMVQGLKSMHQITVARKAGASHATLAIPEMS